MHVFSCHILGNLILLHRILKGACILVSYPWQPRIITPFSKTCTYCILVSYPWQPHIIAPYSKRCMYSCVIFLQPCIITPYSKRCMYSCVISLATSYYCTVFKKVHVFFVSYAPFRIWCNNMKLPILCTLFAWHLLRILAKNSQIVQFSS